MDVIPVIDLMDGAVVHARRGERSSYRPIETPLAEGAEPLAVLAGLMRLARFRRLYIADLDALTGRTGHDRVMGKIAAAYPDLELWVDRGEVDPATLERRRAEGVVPVVGSESFADDHALDVAIKASGGVLSLDHDARGRMGPLGIFDEPTRWPDRVIAMTLARVGAGVGPDLERLGEIVGLAGGRQVFAAGGVRDRADLVALKSIGVAGALVASALHDGRLSPGDLAQALGGPP